MVLEHGGSPVPPLTACLSQLHDTPSAHAPRMQVVTLCGVHNAVPVPGSSLMNGSLPAPFADLPIAKDARHVWKDELQATEWALDKLYPRCNRTTELVATQVSNSTAAIARAASVYETCAAGAFCQALMRPSLLAESRALWQGAAGGLRHPAPPLQLVAARDVHSQHHLPGAVPPGHSPSVCKRPLPEHHGLLPLTGGDSLLQPHGCYCCTLSCTGFCRDASA